MIGIALIGFGSWGPNLARNLEATGARLVAVCDPRPERIAEAATRYPLAEIATHWAEIASNPKVDAVVLATPPSTHFTIAEACLAASKHVLVEKPMTTSRSDAVKLVEGAARRGLTLMVDHTFLYAPAVATVRSLIDDGRVGLPRLYESVRVGARAPTLDTGVVWDLAAHDVAILDHLFGMRPDQIAAKGSPQAEGTPVEDARITLDYPSGLTARLHVGWLSPVKVRTIRLAGDRGTLCYDDMEPVHKVRIEGEADVAADVAPRAPVEPPAAVCREFLDCIATGRRPVSDGEMGLRVVEILELVSASLATGGRTLTLSDAAAVASARVTR
ncbi:MAG: Gfo/Idh/MocA family oxidoreductase [Bauldia sp.]